MLNNNIYHSRTNSKLIYFNNEIPKLVGIQSLAQIANFPNVNGNINNYQGIATSNINIEKVDFKYKGGIDDKQIDKGPESESDDSKDSKRMHIISPSLIEISNLNSHHSIDKQQQKDDLHWPKAFPDILDNNVQRINLPDVILPEEALSTFKFSEMSHEEIWNLINNWK